MDVEFEFRERFRARRKRRAHPSLPIVGRKTAGSRDRDFSGGRIGGASSATGARDESEAKAGIAQVADPSVKAEKNSGSGKTASDHEARNLSAAVASFKGAAVDPLRVDPLREALAALDDRDYATAQRLFTAIGRADVADAIKDALAALDRKDYAKAHGLLETLHRKGAAAAQVSGSAPDSPSPSKPATPAGAPMASDSPNKVQKPVAIPFEVRPIAEAAYRPPLAQAERARSRRFKPLLAGAALALLAIFGVSAIYGSPQNWTFPATKSEALAGLSSAAGVLKADLAAITGQGGREKERSAAPDLSAALTQQTARLDQIEHELGARLDKLSERDQEVLFQICRCGGEARQTGEKGRLAGDACPGIRRYCGEAR